MPLNGRWLGGEGELERRFFLVGLGVVVTLLSLFRGLSYRCLLSCLPCGLGEGESRFGLGECFFLSRRFGELVEDVCLFLS